MIKPRNNNINIIEEMKSNDKRLLVFDNGNSGYIYLFIMNGAIYSTYTESPEECLPGDIYIALVEKVNKGLDGYFVRVNKNTPVYVPSFKNTPILFNRKFNGSIHEGDHVLIKIKKSAFKDKRAAGAFITEEDNTDNEYNELINTAKNSVLYTRVKREFDYICSLNGMYDLSNCKCICNGNICYKYMSDFYKNTFNDITEYSNDSISISALYNIEKLWANITDKKIWLKSGGYIFIEQTEAMNVIDVNTGKSSNKSREENIFKTNIESTYEILYQIEARNLSGVIVVDYINMKNRDSYDEIENILSEGLKKMNPPGVFMGFTHLGNAEIKRNKSLYDIYELQKKINKNILID